MLTLLVISLMLMTADHKFNYFAKLRFTLTYIAVPFQYAVNLPVEIVKSLENIIASQDQLKKENAELRATQLLLAVKVQKLAALEKENAELAGLLHSSSHTGGKVLAAKLLAVDLEPYMQRVVLNKGNQDGLYIGQPVLDMHGVMGQVVRVGSDTSQVLLITDQLSAVPVQDNRNGVRAIAVGLGYEDGLELLHISDTTDVRVGDLLVTSGLGGRFPPGYPVGVIGAINHIPGERFAKVSLTPSAAVNRSRYVLLIWPDKIIAVENKKPDNKTSKDKKAGGKA